MTEEEGTIRGEREHGATPFEAPLLRAPCQGFDARWGHGCKLGVYAQLVYTTLPERDTVLEYLQQKGKGRKIQEVLEVAGALLFRGSHVDYEVRSAAGRVLVRETETPRRAAGDTLSWGIRRAWLLPDGAAEDQPIAAVAPG